MGRWGRFLGIAGIVLFLFGIIGAFITNDFTNPLMAGHVVVGVILVILGLIFTSREGPGSLSKVVTGRKAKFGYSAFIGTALFVAILVGINFVSNNNSKRWDLTEEGIYSLSTQSKKVIDGLAKPLKVVAFTKGIGVSEKDNDRLNLFDQYSEKVTVELVNPATKPHLLERYKMKRGNLIYIAYGEGESIDSDVRLDETTEEAVTNAIIKLTKGAAKKIYYVQGHDEPSLAIDAPDSAKMFVGDLGDEHFSVEPIILSQFKEIPVDAASVIVLSPKKPFLPEELEVLINYAKNGGRLLLFNDPRTTDDISTVAAAFGIEIGKDVIIDQVQRLFAGPTLGAQPVVRDYGTHSITEGLSDSSITIFNQASSVYPLPAGQRQDDATYTEILKTSKSSWAERNLDELFAEVPAAEQGAEDLVGPVTIGVVYEKTIAGATDDKDPVSSRIVVFGDGDFVLNANMNIYANRDLVLNTVNWLSGEESAVSIRPKSYKLSLAPISQPTFLLVLMLSFLLPEVILLSGLAIWWNRRTMTA